MAKTPEDIFLEESKEGVTKDKYRIITASSSFLLQERINELLDEGNWALLGAAFESLGEWCQTMVRVPKDKIARQSIA